MRGVSHREGAKLRHEEPNLTPEEARAMVWFLRTGQRAPCPPARGSGERCKLPQQSPGWSPGKFEIWCNLRPQKSLKKYEMH